MSSGHHYDGCVWAVAGRGQGEGGRSCQLDESDHNHRHTDQQGALACQQPDADVPLSGCQRTIHDGSSQPLPVSIQTHSTTIETPQAGTSTHQLAGRADAGILALRSVVLVVTNDYTYPVYS